MRKEIPWWTPEIGALEYDLIKGVLASNYVNEGVVTEEFERRLAELLEVKHVTAVTSGTAAIMLALAGLGIGPGDEVIVPDVTFIATANAVVLAGASPVLVDIDPHTLNLDVDAAVRAITVRTKAIVPVHVSGRAACMGAILDVARQHGLFVVEDAAEALTSRHDGRYLGTLGDAGCLSFSPNKTITTGQGGAVLTNDDHLHVRLHELKDQGRPVRGTGGDDVHHTVGYNFKFTNLQAALGLGQLSYLDRRVARIKETYRTYARALHGIDGISLPGFRLEDGESPQWIDAIVDRRDELDRYLVARNVHCRRFWFPLHTQSAYRQSDDRFPNSTRACQRALWLPSAFTLSDEDVTMVCGDIAEFLTERAAAGAAN
jgi:perosamine synthetase